MDEILIPKKWLLVVLALLGLGTGLLWAVPRVLGSSLVSAGLAPTPAPAEEIQTGQDDSLAQNAAAAGAQAFYSVDYRAGQQAWLDRLCAISTQTGCVVYQNVIAPNLWPAFEQAQTVTTVKVAVQEKVDEGIAATRAGAPTQVWRLQVELSDPWPVQADPQTSFSALALVIQEQGDWKFERFLSEEEWRALANPGGQP